MQSFKECQIDIINDEEIPTFQLDMGTVRRNGYYKFYQQYDYIPRKDGSIPPTTLGDCIGPLGPHRLGVRKIKVKNEEVADEIYIRIKENESTFEEISKFFSNDNGDFYAEKKVLFPKIIWRKK